MPTITDISIETKIYVDQLGQKVEISGIPKRIVSLVPSQTELLFHLGLDSEIVGVTKFCVHPLEKCRSKENVGGTKKIHINHIDKLKPDLILANKEENLKEDIHLLSAKYPVWTSDISTLKEACQMIKEIGKITHTTSKARDLIKLIRVKFKKLPQFPSLKVLYLIWRKPFMAAGKGTFIDHMLTQCGFQNAVNEERYPEVENIEADIIMLSSEPFPFKEKHKEEIKELYPNAQIELVDGEMFSWYGSRLLYFPDYVSDRFRDLRSSQNVG